jgi:hypothetical protein
MKKLLTGFLFFVVVAGSERPDYTRIFRQLHTLEGSWHMKTSKGFTGETWVKVNDRLLHNTGFVVRGKDTVITERVALYQTDSSISYISTVADQNNSKPVTFVLTSGADNIFVFENPLHDFPKRITYQLINKDSLDAWIDGGKGGGTKRTSFNYSRVRN